MSHSRYIPDVPDCAERCTSRRRGHPDHQVVIADCNVRCVECGADLDAVYVFDGRAYCVRCCPSQFSVGAVPAVKILAEELYESE